MSTKGVKIIATKRATQIMRHGYTSKHDDEHTCAEIADAAAVFLNAYQYQAVTATYCKGVLVKHGTPKASIYKIGPGTDSSAPLWPWSNTPRISKDKIENLANAGACIAAEIDRLLRLQRRLKRHKTMRR